MTVNQYLDNFRVSVPGGKQFHISTKRYRFIIYDIYMEELFQINGAELYEDPQLRTCILLDDLPYLSHPVATVKITPENDGHKVCQIYLQS